MQTPGPSPPETASCLAVASLTNLHAVVNLPALFSMRLLTCVTTALTSMETAEREDAYTDQIQKWQAPDVSVAAT